MAYTGQYLEGIEALYLSMGVPLNRPELFCDNKAACHLTEGSQAWRTQALVKRILGLHNLVQLGKLVISYKSTAEMAADILTKFMKKNVLQRCRDFVGCVELPGAQAP